jgi:hypothetical protein
MVHQKKKNNKEKNKEEKKKEEEKKEEEDNIMEEEIKCVLKKMICRFCFSYFSKLKQRM